MQACRPWGCRGARGAMEISADQLTLCQPRGADYAQQIILAPHGHPEGAFFKNLELLG